jgi:hypothetical protein
MLDELEVGVLGDVSSPEPPAPPAAGAAAASTAAAPTAPASAESCALSAAGASSPAAVAVAPAANAMPPPPPRAKIPPPAPGTAVMLSTQSLLPSARLSLSLRLSPSGPSFSPLGARAGAGYSQLDWARKLAGPAAAMRGRIAMADVAKHNKRDDCWIVLRGAQYCAGALGRLADARWRAGRVYDVTAYLPYHPGGARSGGRAGAHATVPRRR